MLSVILVLVFLSGSQLFIDLFVISSNFMSVFFCVLGRIFGTFVLSSYIGAQDISARWIGTMTFSSLYLYHVKFSLFLLSLI